MTPLRTFRFFSMSLGLSAVLAASLVGCGGSTPDADDAVLTPPPDAVTSTAGAPAAAGAAPAATAPAAEAAAPVATASATSGGWGTLKGRVVFDGAAPTPKVLVAQGDKAVKDADVCAKGQITSDRLDVNAETKGVRFALVFLPKPTAVKDEAKKAAATAAVEFDQDGCVFKPHVLGVMTGATIMIKSSDPVGHNVNSKVRNSEMNQQLSPSQTFPFTPSAPSRQPGRVTCDIHPWMEAYWMVLDNPYFAVTDEKGDFTIKDVPSGTQKVAVWQEAVGFVTPASGVDVAIAADKETSQEFTVESGKVKGE